jgi:hypothetical protein
LRSGLTTDMAATLPFGYEMLTAERLEWLP